MIGGRIGELDMLLRNPNLTEEKRRSMEQEKKALSDLKQCIDRAFAALPSTEAAMARFAFYIDWDTPHARIPQYSQFMRWKWMNMLCNAIDPEELEARYAHASKYLKER